MSTEARSAEDSVAVARTWLVLLLIAAYRLGRCAVAFVGLTHWLGVPWASALVLLAVLLRWKVLLQILVVLTLVTLWHWPALLAVIAVAPRLVTILPGLLRTWGASRRHPRPRWSPVEEAS